MKLLVSGCTVSTKRLIGERPDRIGILLTPSNGNREWWGESETWSADNDCFRGLDAVAYLRMVARILTFRTKPAWVTVPDTVGDAAKTLESFWRWHPVLSGLGLKLALVGQDGLTSSAVPWDRIDCFFVGGSTAWKVGDVAAKLTLEARARGKLVHFGRVNTLKRITYIGRRMRDGELWCDTFDGTGFSAYGDKRIPLAIRWIDKVLADRQTVMFGGLA